MNTFDQCNYTTYMVMFNDRLSDWSFAGGMATNLVTQLALYPYSGVQSPIYKSWNSIYNGILNKNYENVGISLQLFLSKLISS